MSDETVDDYRRQALTEYRAVHPEVDDLPDEAVLSLGTVQSRVFGLALDALGRDILEAFAEPAKRIAKALRRTE